MIRHGDEIVEKQKGQNAINVDEILTYYPAITKPNNHDLRIVQDNGNIFYAKQINGHFIAIEEVLTGRNKIKFVTAWNINGSLNDKMIKKLGLPHYLRQTGVSARAKNST
ncbi:hypothetical protein [Helicobacter bilis]|uniref:Phage-Barnase-EndoU-ColicinE5/D-RelE like nuclease 3 domain-containing protein n=1 Tax=Helicobacter bilis TaxID=37372 RepID=A0A4U8UCM6_9HELI|nr:hypothetical protein [Helicobacter bilis]TLE08262.1 hypothetical protein LS78_006190 [Helicobacter bilis]TLE09951.1 hypothetical protein LS79_007070 [Helicobacter bilis]